MFSLFLLSFLSLESIVNAIPLRARQASVPAYVYEYAPILWLESTEAYMPSDIASQLVHIIPEENFTPITSGPNPLTLDNVNTLNNIDGGADVYLTSREGIKALPSWLKGVTPNASGKTVGATSCAIITVDKGSGLLDAFYMYFYAYNQGNNVLGISTLQFGDHVGDWEHNMVRFQNGVPQAIWYSQHATGEAFTYDAVQKINSRPVSFVANGTHAVYGTAGTHDHTIPNLDIIYGPLEDYTDEGYLWDPTLSAYVYSYDEGSNTFAAYESGTPVNWLYFWGRWGDAQLPNSAAGQLDVLGNYKYVAGPTGPIDKALNRTAVCPSSSGCVVREVMLPGN